MGGEAPYGWPNLAENSNSAKYMQATTNTFGTWLTYHLELQLVDEGLFNYGFGCAIIDCIGQYNT